MKDELGDRMKAYERIDTDRRYTPDQPLVVRLDGRTFSTFTRGMDKPFDRRMTQVMQDVAAHMVEKTHAKIGYTQSDEITLLYPAYSDAVIQAVGTPQPIFGGRLFKIMSVLSGMASSRFVLGALEHWPEHVRKAVPHFDCRVFSVPNEVEAVNALIWRENDASRNAVQAIAQATFSHRECQHKSTSELEGMLFENNIRVSDYPMANRYGTYFARRTFRNIITAEDLDDATDSAKKYMHVGQMIQRTRVVDLELSPLVRRQDRVELIFGPKPSFTDQNPEPAVRVV